MPGITAGYGDQNIGKCIFFKLNKVNFSLIPGPPTP